MLQWLQPIFWVSEYLGNLRKSCQSICLMLGRRKPPVIERQVLSNIHVTRCRSSTAKIDGRTIIGFPDLSKQFRHASQIMDFLGVLLNSKRLRGLLNFILCLLIYHKLCLFLFPLYQNRQLLPSLLKFMVKNHTIRIVKTSNYLWGNFIKF